MGQRFLRRHLVTQAGARLYALGVYYGYLFFGVFDRINHHFKGVDVYVSGIGIKFDGDILPRRRIVLFEGRR